VDRQLTQRETDGGRFMEHGRYKSEKMEKGMDRRDEACSSVVEL